MDTMGRPLPQAASGKAEVAFLSEAQWFDVLTSRDIIQRIYNMDSYGFQWMNMDQESWIRFDHVCFDLIQMQSSGLFFENHSIHHSRAIQIWLCYDLEFYICPFSVWHWSCSPDVGPSASPRQAGSHLRDRDRRIAELEARVAQQDQQVQMQGFIRISVREMDRHQQHPERWGRSHPPKNPRQ